MSTPEFEKEIHPQENFQKNLEAESNFSITLARRVNGYIENSMHDGGVLRSHQQDVFHDLKSFFEQDQRRGYIELPTGTGKTVLFVELSKAILGNTEEEDGQKPKILVVSPTRDLVHQTLGRKGEKGYGKFAPELKVGSYFSDTPAKEKQDFDAFDVVVTTYRSFETLSKRNIYKPVADFSRDVLESDYFKNLVESSSYEMAVNMLSGIKAIPTDRMMLDKFDVVIFDEAHHIFGETTKKILESLPDDKIVIGFTATPEADELKKLSNILPNKIHEMGLPEAITLELASSVIAVGISSGMQIENGDIFDESGEFIDSRISYLAQDPVRNERIIKAAKIFKEHDIGTIVSCIKGDGAWHARFIAELARREGIRAVAVYDQVPTAKRNEIYREFDKGNIDLLSFIGVIGEGWDSQRAKALINARPSRSRIFTKQRLGRTTRPGNPAFVVDIHDKHDGKNPPITGADILDSGDIPYGAAIGVVDPDSYVGSVLQSLKESLPVLDVLEGEFTHNRQFISELQKLDRGALRNARGGAEYSLASIANKSYIGVTDEIIEKIEELTGVTVTKKNALQGGVVRSVYQVDQVRNLLQSLPKVDPYRFYIDQNRQRWISNKGLVKLFSKRFPGLEESDVKTAMSKTNLDWIPASWEREAKYLKYKFVDVFKLYKADQNSIDSINLAIDQYLKIKSTWNL